MEKQFALFAANHLSSQYQTVPSMTKEADSKSNGRKFVKYVETLTKAGYLFALKMALCYANYVRYLAAQVLDFLESHVF